VLSSRDVPFASGAVPARQRSLGTSASRAVRFPEARQHGAVTDMELQGVGIEGIKGSG
jgi:hypothetical protein